MTTLTHSLGDKLLQVMEPEKNAAKRRQASPRHNPRSGIDLPDVRVSAPDPLEEDSEMLQDAQNTLDSRDKNDEEAGTASKNTNNQNIRMETHMETTTHENVSSNNQQSKGQESFDNRALNVAESATRSLEKVAQDGITIKPAFKRRRAEGYAVAGAAVGIAVGAAGGTLLMGRFGNNPTNQDITGAAYVGALIGGAAFGLGGNALGGYLDDKDATKTEK